MEREELFWCSASRSDEASAEADDVACAHGSSLGAKIIVVGDAQVGKTSLIARCLGDDVARCDVSADGLCISTKAVLTSGRQVMLSLWDVDASDAFTGTRDALYRDAQVVVIAYDVGRRATLAHARDWLDEVGLAVPHAALILAGCKCELSGARRVVSADEGRALAQQLGAQFVETSAVSGRNALRLLRLAAAGVDAAGALAASGADAIALDCTGSSSSHGEDITIVVPRRGPLRRYVCLRACGCARRAPRAFAGTQRLDSVCAVC